MTKLVRLLICASLLLVCNLIWADVGVLIPGDEEEPDPAKLTLDELHIDIRIDRQYAAIRMVQIFGNHLNQNMEGKYVFAIPGDAAISDFAVWDGVIRIPGVILERKRASEIYEELRIQEIDPGLLQQEEGADGPRMASAFSARIVPIPPYGTKRLEIEYTQRLNIEGAKSYFALPLQPDLFREQTVGLMTVSLRLESGIPVSNFNLLSATYPMNLSAAQGTTIQGTFETRNVMLKDDFSFEYTIDPGKSDLAFEAFRGTDQQLRASGQPVTAVEQPSQRKVEDGYFWTSALINEKTVAATHPPKSVVILLDTSSSMRWEKLEQSYAALEYFLRKLPEQDEFQLILFHQETKASSESPLPATKSNVENTLSFVKAQYLMGGTDFSKALKEAFAASAKFKNEERYLILITDGNPTLTQIQTSRLIDTFREQNEVHKLRAFGFGIGSDANRTLLSAFAESSNGHFDWVRETEDINFKLQAFFAKIGDYPASGLTLTSSKPDLLYNVYPSEPSRVYDGSSIDWFGRYRAPASSVQLSVNGELKGRSISVTKNVEFPDVAVEHHFIPRGWAKMRVDALLRKMELEGEDDASIDEIIALAKKYKFVTPYTSFLAAPRSLLRPRVIRPGDPILRVRADSEIVSISVIFPFGLIKNLEYLQSEDIWQTRFLVPKEFSDGTYTCRLILRDRSGNQYEEEKTFLVDSRPPVFKTKWEGKFERGRSVKIIISADHDTRSLFAGIESMRPARVQWNSQAKASVGFIDIPADLPPGRYKLQVVGEDFAHNISRWSTIVEVY